MIVFINLNGSPATALGGLVLCLLLNGLIDWTSGLSRGGSLWLELTVGTLGLVVTVALMLLLFKWALSPAGAPNLRTLLASLVGGQAAAAAGAAQQRHGQGQTAQQRQQRWDKVVSALQRLPTDIVASEAMLKEETAQQLKARLAQLGADCVGAVEKSELVRAVLAKQAACGAGVGDTCCICCEEYEPHDCLRVLPCKHRQHLTCIDRWLLTACQDYSRPPACPLCNAELPL